MGASTREAHLSVLKDVQADIEKLHQKIEELKAVEKYHSDKVKELANDTNGATPVPVQRVTVEGVIAAQSDQVKELRASLTATTTKHDAAEFALRAIGGPSKPREIMNILQNAGYGRGLKDLILRNSLSTAMLRKPQTFRKLDDGRWALIQNGTAESEGQ